jgi:predicted glutamine amidotransferase
VPSIEETTLTLAELVAQLNAHGTFNILLSNGQALWAHGSTRLFWLERRHPFAHATLADEDLSVDFSSVTTADDRVAVIATEPLTANEHWVPFDAGELRVFVDGVCSARR